jgi:hypothetical protein
MKSRGNRPSQCLGYYQDLNADTTGSGSDVRHPQNDSEFKQHQIPKTCTARYRRHVQRGPERTKEYTVRDEGGLPDVPKSTQASKHHTRPISALQFPARVLTTAQMYTPRLAY